MTGNGDEDGNRYRGFATRMGIDIEDWQREQGSMKRIAPPRSHEKEQYDSNQVQKRRTVTPDTYTTISHSPTKATDGVKVSIIEVVSHGFWQVYSRILRQS